MERESHRRPGSVLTPPLHRCPHLPPLLGAHVGHGSGLSVGRTRGTRCPEDADAGDVEQDVFSDGRDEQADGDVEPDGGKVWR